MNGEKIFQAISDIDGRFVAEAACYARGGAAQAGKSPYRRKRMLAVALAAALILALGVTAYAMGLFSLAHRPKAPEEKYTIYWTDFDGNERANEHEDFKYVFKFSGPDECRGVRFKEGWLPFAPNEGRNDWAKDEEGWRSELVSENAPDFDFTFTNYQPYSVHLYYAPRYKDNSALLLNAQNPEEIAEEQWDEHKVLRIHATRMQGGEMFNYYFVILFHPEKGYIAVVSGTSDMETIEHIARELTFRQTDEIIRKSDYSDNIDSIDVGQG